MAALKPAFHFPVDGPMALVYPANGKGFTLEEVQALVGGYVELLHAGPDLFALFNEEGRLHGMKPNVEANRVVAEKTGANWDLVGPVVLTPKKYFT